MVETETPTDTPLPAVHLVDELDHLKVLADPLRLRILECLCLEARTTKQVAQQIGEPPTRLYHHVDALETAGLIRLERTRPVRGTLEKYYRAVARSFRADPSLFALDRSGAASVAAELVEMGAAELRSLDVVPAENDPDRAFMAGGLSLTLSRERLAEVRERLEGLLETVQAWVEDDAQHDSGGGSDEESAETHRLVFALFPIDRKTPSETEETDP